MANELAEFLGTFALILIGAGSICADVLSGGKLGITGIALAHGLTIMVMVYALGHQSGGHFNPAVTAAMWLNRRIQPLRALRYVAAQLAGAAAAAFLLRWIHPDLTHMPPYLGACRLTEVTVAVGIVIEAVLTLFLALAIWGTAIDPRSPKAAAGLAIGLTITLDVLMGGYSTGAAMNPARAFGPALAIGQWQHHLVYWLGPLIGACAGGLLYERIFLVKKRP